VTLRDNTERRETVEVGANMLAGSEPGRIVECARIMMERGRTWVNPLGDGMAGERIMRVMEMGLGKLYKWLANHGTITKFSDFNKFIRRRLTLIYADLWLHQHHGNNWKKGQCQV
ncbi:MAG: UDP-N-acetyl glucosamine 2-epimerase, partial [ANME-2 cluster archaeon]|nr:UDP-N-acetyl glucosamine 2-epimerase [ANME-2 cluster archaeon]